MKSIIVRIICGLSIMTLWYIGGWLWSIPLILWLSLRHVPFELVCFGILIDAQFLIYAQLPWYTIGATVWLFMIEWLKPMILIYTKPV
jgi:hypothetical protein